MTGYRDCDVSPRQAARRKRTESAFVVTRAWRERYAPYGTGYEVSHAGSGLIAGFVYVTDRCSSTREEHRDFRDVDGSHLPRGMTAKGVEKDRLEDLRHWMSAAVDRFREEGGVLE